MRRQHGPHLKKKPGFTGAGGRGRGCTQVAHGRSRMTIDLLCRDGAHRVFTNQADIACNKREAPWGGGGVKGGMLGGAC